MGTIPKNIFQTHKSKDYIKSHTQLLKAVSTWFKYKNEFNYFFFDNEKCDQFIKNNFDEKVYKAYSMLPMAVMKSDLWRYCVLYKYGGIYADADTICKVHPNIFINNSLLTVAPEHSGIFFCQWCFSAPANSPILRSVIDLSVERILTTPIKGEHIIHHLTGPAVFTDGIEKYLKENNKPVFANKHHYFNYPDKNILSVFNSNNFHNKFIIHLGAGGYEDGWKKERYQKLM
jgi:mannosyltransferase OCH1-like enzyme